MPVTRSPTAGSGRSCCTAGCSTTGTVEPTASPKFFWSAAVTAISPSRLGQPPASQLTCSHAPARHCSTPIGDRSVWSARVTSSDVPSMRGSNQVRAEAGSRPASSSRDAASKLGEPTPNRNRDSDRISIAVAPAGAESTLNRVSACCMARS